MKLLKKISIGTINSVRGGLKSITGRMLVMMVAGITGSYKEKTSETMGTSYAFIGEFRAVNQHGEECTAPIAYLPEPAQSLLKSQIDDLVKSGATNVEFGFKVFAVEDETALKGYYFELEPLMEARPSTALQELTQRIGVSLPTDGLGDAGAVGRGALLGHDTAPDQAADVAETASKGKGKGKK